MRKTLIGLLLVIGLLFAQTTYAATNNLVWNWPSSASAGTTLCATMKVENNTGATQRLEGRYTLDDTGLTYVSSSVITNNTGATIQLAYNASTREFVARPNVAFADGKKFVVQICMSTPANYSGHTLYSSAGNTSVDWTDFFTGYHVEYPVTQTLVLN